MASKDEFQAEKSLRTAFFTYTLTYFCLMSSLDDLRHLIVTQYQKIEKIFKMENTSVYLI